MGEYVNNPRRAPRAVLGCDARVALRSGGYFKGATVDYGPAGCQLVAPTPLPRDERVFVEIRSGALPDASLVSGRVAWTADEEPYRSGVQFDAGSRDAAAIFYGALSAALPELVEADDVPDRVPIDAWIVPWRREPDAQVLPAEEVVLRAVGSGVRLRELRMRLGDRWEAALNPLFALLARRLLIVQREAEQGPPG